MRFESSCQCVATRFQIHSSHDLLIYYAMMILGDREQLETGPLQVD